MKIKYYLLIHEPMQDVLGERLSQLDEDQNALFVLSWSRSLAETSASLDKTFAEIDWHRANHYSGASDK